MSDRGARGIAACGAACGVAVLAGCGAVGGAAAPEAPLWLHHPGSALGITMRRELTAESRKADEDYERGRPEIDAAHLRIFVGSSDHGLYALRADSGEVLWRFETLGAVQCEPLYDAASDVVYFGSNDGALYMVRASDGGLLHRFMTNAEVARRPVLRDGTLYVMNANDTLMALDATTLAMRWHQHRTPAFGMEVAGYAGPTVAGDRVYTAFSDGTVMAYDRRDGSEQWPTVDLAAEAEQATGEAPKYLDVDTTPIVHRISSGEVVFVAGYAGGVFALDAQDGSRAWVNEKATGVTELVLWEQPAHRPRGGEGPEVPARKILLAASGLTGLWALDPEDGRTIWRRNLPEGGISAPVPWVGALLVATTRYGLFLFSPTDGAVIDGIDTGGGVAMTPAVHGRRAFVLTNGGALLGLHVQAPTPGG
ncbi:MAG: PQQ-binding-like beta-propeller repeat protein [Polyangiaceae bacterium]|nr:PQQ-binding-like beta-propeller repeat protein [Polyangiaceae bacterium]